MIVYFHPEQLAALFFWHRSWMVCLALPRLASPCPAAAFATAFFVSSFLLLDFFFLKPGIYWVLFLAPCEDVLQQALIIFNTVSCLMAV